MQPVGMSVMQESKTTNFATDEIKEGKLDTSQEHVARDLLDGSSVQDVNKALKTNTYGWALVACTILSIASTLIAMGIGPAFIVPSTVIDIIGHHTISQPAEITWKASHDAIIWDVRLPRVLLGAIVGSGLAVAGVALQSITRNPLAEPHILGVNSGASVGAALAILFGVGASFGGQSVAIVAFLGALGAMVAVLGLSRVGGAVTPGKMLIAGVAVSYLLSSITSLLVMFDDSEQGARSVMFWLMGSLARAEWETLPAVGATVVAVCALLWWWRRRLDVLAIGDETARAVGVDPAKTRWVLVVFLSLMIGATVAASGGIGFVGLAVPHISRRLVGVAHRNLIPASALLGALLLVWADVCARMLIEPREIPIGVITGLVGAPILVALVRRLQAANA